MQQPPSNKVFHFEAIVFTCPEAKQQLFAFMKQERNEENLILLDLLMESKQELKHICNTSMATTAEKTCPHFVDWKQKVNQLLRKYLSQEIPMANVSQQCSHMVLQEWEQIMNQSESEMESKFAKVIKPLEVSLLMVIKADVFPRFVRSQIWNQYIANLKPVAIQEAFLHKVTVNDSVYQLEKTFQYTYNMLFGSAITIRDVEFAKMISEDDLASGWTFLAYDKKNTKVSSYVNTKKSFLADQSVADEAQLVSASKFVGYLPYDLETTFFGIAGTLQQVKMMLPSLSKLDFVTLKEEEKAASKLDYCFPQTSYTHQTDLKIPLLRLREGVANALLFKIEKQNQNEIAYMCILKTSSEECHPYSSNSITLTHFLCLYFTKSLLNSNETRYIYTFLGNGGGWLKGKFNKLSAELTKKRAVDQHKHFAKVVSQWNSLSVEEKKKAVDADPGQLFHRIQILRK